MLLVGDPRPVVVEAVVLKGHDGSLMVESAVPLLARVMMVASGGAGQVLVSSMFVTLPLMDRTSLLSVCTWVLIPCSNWRMSCCGLTTPVSGVSG